VIFVNAQHLNVKGLWCDKLPDNYFIDKKNTKISDNICLAQ
jgi:hypothetical protein